MTRSILGEVENDKINIKRNCQRGDQHNTAQDRVRNDKIIPGKS